MINAKRIIVTSSQRKVLPWYTSNVSESHIFEKLIKKDVSSDFYFCLSGFCGSPALKSSIVTT